MNPWSQLLGTGLSVHIKKYLFDVLKERYPRNEEFIERLATILLTSKDLDGFGKFVADIYEVGYMKSLNDHQKELESKGLRASIRPDMPQEFIDQNRIFPK